MELPSRLRWQTRHCDQYGLGMARDRIFNLGMRNPFSQETSKLIVSLDLATFLFPTPAEIKYQDGTFKIPTELSVYSKDDFLRDLLPISPLSLNLCNETSAPIHLVRQDFSHEEAFRILCSPEKSPFSLMEPQAVSLPSCIKTNL